MPATYADEAARAARLAERISLAVLTGTTAPDADTLAQLREANHRKAVLREAQAVADLRAGRPPVAVPARAPWSGF